jgi:hypothetical protein
MRKEWIAIRGMNRNYRKNNSRKPQVHELEIKESHLKVEEEQ